MISINSKKISLFLLMKALNLFLPPEGLLLNFIDFEEEDGGGWDNNIIEEDEI